MDIVAWLKLGNNFNIFLNTIKLCLVVRSNDIFVTILLNWFVVYHYTLFTIESIEIIHQRFLNNGIIVYSKLWICKRLILKKLYYEAI